MKPMWQAEKTGHGEWLVVLRWGRGQQQDIARNDAGRIIWFPTQASADAHATELNRGRA